MGADYYANAIVGYKVGESALYQEHKHRGCEHPEPDENANYCPQCGNPVWVNERQARDEFDEAGMTFGDFKIIVPGILSEVDEVFIGIGCSGRLGEPGHMVIPQQERLEEVHNYLFDKIVEIAEEDEPRIWAVQNASY